MGCISGVLRDLRLYHPQKPGLGHFASLRGGGGKGNGEKWRDRDRERFLACERSRVWGGERTGAALTVVMATQTNPAVPVNTTVCESFSKPKPQDRKEGGQQSPGYGDHP